MGRACLSRGGPVCPEAGPVCPDAGLSVPRWAYLMFLLLLFCFPLSLKIRDPCTNEPGKPASCASPLSHCKKDSRVSPLKGSTCGSTKDVTRNIIFTIALRIIKQNRMAPELAILIFQVKVLKPFFLSSFSLGSGWASRISRFLAILQVEFAISASIQLYRGTSASLDARVSGRQVQNGSTKARIWSWLSYFCRNRSTSVCKSTNRKRRCCRSTARLSRKCRSVLKRRRARSRPRRMSRHRSRD